MELSFSPWLFLLLGLALAFFGRALVVLNIALLGALLGAAAGSALLSALLAAGMAPPGGLAVEVLQLIALVLGALVGWVLAGLVRRAAVVGVGADVRGAAPPAGGP